MVCMETDLDLIEKLEATIGTEAALCGRAASPAGTFDRIVGGLAGSCGAAQREHASADGADSGGVVPSFCDERGTSR